MHSSKAAKVYIFSLCLFCNLLMPSSRSSRQCKFNNCCCNPFNLCSSMLGLRRSPLCKSSLGRCILALCLTTITARKASSSSNTSVPLDKNIGEGTISKAMASDAPAVNGSQTHDNVHLDKQAVIAKEPEASKSMVYEPLSVKKSNAMNNGTTSHTSNTMTQRKMIPLSILLTLIANNDLILQALEPVRIPPKAGANLVLHSQKTSRSQFFKRRSSQHDGSLSQILIMLTIATFIA